MLIKKFNYFFFFPPCYGTRGVEESTFLVEDERKERLLLTSSHHIILKEETRSKGKIRKKACKKGIHSSETHLNEPFSRPSSHHDTW